MLGQDATEQDRVELRRTRRIWPVPAASPTCFHPAQRSPACHRRAIRGGRHIGLADRPAARGVYRLEAQWLHGAKHSGFFPAGDLAAHLPDRYLADPDLLRAIGLAAQLWPGRTPDPARHHALFVPAHLDPAAGALGDAGSAARRLHQVRARPRPAATRHPLRPCAEEHHGAGDHHHGFAIGLRHCLRHRDGNRFPVAGHGPAVHPGRAICRHPRDGGLPLSDCPGICCDQPAGRPAVLPGRSTSAHPI
uniref:SH3 domain-containing protein n=1 Tax=Parastrongyloides trichosuri TaxID=131310 RepID=A0A0N4ZEE8_PARTI